MATTLQFTDLVDEYITAAPFDAEATWSMQLRLTPDYVASVVHRIVKLGNNLELRVNNFQLELIVNGTTYPMGLAPVVEHTLRLMQTVTTVEVYVDAAKVGDSGVDTLAPAVYSLVMLQGYKGSCIDIVINASGIYPMQEGVGLTLWNAYRGPDELGPMSLSPLLADNWTTLVVQYATREDVEFIYGKTNVIKWADLENTDDVNEIDSRIRYALSQSVNDINDRLRGGRYRVPFNQPTASKIVELSAIMTGLWLYQWRGITDFDAASGTVDHQLSRFELMAKRSLNAILAGQTTLDAVGDPGQSQVPKAGFADAE